MADKKITDLTSASALTGTEEFAVVQGGSTKKVTASAIKTYTVTGGGGGSDSSSSITPTLITAESGTTVELGDSQYDDAVLIFFTASATDGNTIYRLPDATTNQYRVITFVCDDGFSDSNFINIKPIQGQTLEDFIHNQTGIVLNSDFEIAKVWSTGTKWILIQRELKTIIN